PRGFADLLARELGGCGVREVRERATGAAFLGTLESVYRACLWSRIANRVFVELARFDARDADEFHAAVREIDWAAHLAPGTTLACDFSGRHPTITHTHFGALKLKDGIVDALRLATGARPDVALERPGVRVHAHARGTNITVSIDLSGDSLHRRGYRGAAGEAPLKENVAAGVLLRGGGRGGGAGHGARNGSRPERHRSRARQRRARRCRAAGAHRCGSAGRCSASGGARSGSARTPVHQSSLRPAHGGPRGRADAAP